jgi:hypothetical protein
VLEKFRAADVGFVRTPVVVVVLQG